MSAPPSPGGYVLGHTDRELRRLDTQAQTLLGGGPRSVPLVRQLADRLAEEARATGCVILGRLQVGCWSRVAG